ncbi:DinB family protein [Paenibacillus sp. DYY-L-2]|uniref:DinB family protein n=1 Tax=Paenibacillus sp. DYY-L-2 TaxID=3447013 RepID=UPI003F507B4D
MKTTTETLQRFEKTVAYYLNELENFEMEHLLKKTNEEEWSIGQMYLHLIQSAQFLHLQNVDHCLAGKAEALSTEQEKTDRGKLTFENGSFPPVRVRVPASPQYTPQQPESKEQLSDGLRSVLLRMQQIEPALSQASERNKIIHPAFGALNAVEWFMLIEMHYRHHLMQLERLKQEFN